MRVHARVTPTLPISRTEIRGIFPKVEPLHARGFSSTVCTLSFYGLSRPKLLPKFREPAVRGISMERLITRYESPRIHVRSFPAPVRTPVRAPFYGSGVPGGSWDYAGNRKRSAIVSSPPPRDRRRRRSRIVRPTCAARATTATRAGTCYLDRAFTGRLHASSSAAGSGRWRRWRRS